MGVIDPPEGVGVVGVSQEEPGGIGVLEPETEPIEMGDRVPPPTEFKGGTGLMESSEGESRIEKLLKI